VPASAPAPASAGAAPRGLPWTAAACDYSGPDRRKLASREQKWQAMFHKFTNFRHKKAATFQGRIMKWIPNSVRGKAWLYIVHPDSVQWDDAARASKDSRRSRFMRWMQKGELPNPPPAAIPGLAPVKEDTTGDDLANIVRALLGSDPSKMPYSPNVGYIASLFLGYLPAWRAFTAVLYLFTSSKHRVSNYFHVAQVGEIAKVWERALLKHAAAIQRKFNGLEVQHVDYLTDWLQTAFLKIEFAPELRLRIFDRFIKFGTPALLSFGIVIVHALNEKLQTAADREAVLALLKNPSGAEFFSNLDTVIKKLDSVWVRKKDYQAWCRACSMSDKEFP
jgi:hypothetical protein